MIHDPTKTVTIPDFSSTKSNAVCGNFVYEAKNSADSSAIDSSVFTFTSANPPTLDISSNDHLKPNTYSINIVGHQGIFTSHTIFLTV